MNTRYMVAFDDGMGLCMPFGLHPCGDGSLGNYRPIALFLSRKAARRAINISKAAYRHDLLRVDRESKWTDWQDFSPECVKNIKIVKCDDVPATDVEDES